MVVAQLVERSLLTTEIRSSNPVSGEIYINSCIEKTKIEKMGRDCPLKRYVPSIGPGYFLVWAIPVCCWPVWRSMRFTLTFVSKWWFKMCAESGGAWIAEWYHTRVWSSVRCTIPWAVSLSQVHVCFFHYSIWLIWFDTIFVCQICHVNCETENWNWKKFIYLFLKKCHCAESKVDCPGVLLAVMQSEQWWW